MPERLLRTKLHIPPLRPDWVLRPHLLERLDAGLQRKLTLVSAPAGSGKTTLVSAWLHHLTGAQDDRSSEGKPRAAAWLSLDAGDNDALRFFSYLVAALQEVDSHIGQDLAVTLAAAKAPPLSEWVIGLLNDIVQSRIPLILVLDDYHLIQELAIHEALASLIDRQPPSLHVVIATRHDPPFPLPRWRARGQLAEIRDRDLRFSPQEAAILFSQALGLQLNAAQVATLAERTEGWVAGLLLTGLSMQGRAAAEIERFIDGFSGRQVVILDYLMDEVVARQPEAVQAFLLRTSILQRLSGPLCDALLEPEGGVAGGGQAMLEKLQRDNLFVMPLDGERQWYRYHQLFADLLQATLQTTCPELVPALHRRAAVWHEQGGLATEAVRHALAAGDFYLAADMVQRGIQQITTWSSLDVATFLRWIRALPDWVLNERPWLQLYAARAYFAAGQPQASERLRRSLEQKVREPPKAADAQRVLELMDADRASYALVHGELSQTFEWLERVEPRLAGMDASGRLRVAAIHGMAQLRAGDVREAHRQFSMAISSGLASGLGFALAPLLCNLAEVERLQGRLQQSMLTCQRAAEMGKVDGAAIPSTGFVGLGLARIRYEQNDLTQAERDVREGLDLLHQGGITESFGLGHTLLARIKQAQGEPGAAQRAMQQALQVAQASGIQRIVMLASAYQARLWLAQGRPAEAARWASEYQAHGPTEYLREVEDLTLARVWLAQKQTEKALSLLARLLAAAEAAGRMGRVIEMQALQAVALDQLDSREAAVQALARALELAEPEGYVRVFLNEGAPMAGLLEHAAARGAAYGRNLLQEWRAGCAAPQPSPLAEQLTGRELEMLELLAQGLSNREIADLLVLSPNTVRTHLYHLYAKLAVHSRLQAVLRGRELGLLPPEVESPA
jgi:LuxR family maltose regulon positive regulatory protein